MVWSFIADRLKRRQNVMLMVVTESSGSSPGRPGFKMAVDAHGALCGSIGGGMMEMKLVELARHRLLKRQEDGLVKRQIHRKTAGHDRSGMICSGEQTVLLLPLGFGELPQVRRILRCRTSNRPAVLRIRSGGPEPASAFPAFTILEDRHNDTPFRFEARAEGDFLYEENLGLRHQLYIVGGGHCALALSELMSRMDFYIRLFDDRPELSTMLKNRFVHEKHTLESYAGIGGLIPEGQDVYVVVMTLGYRTDELVIRELCDKDFKYFGVLGSGAKMAVLLDSLKKEGFAPEKLDRIRTPIGLKINSRTPEEIAVSIAAEIIAVKNG